MEFDPAQLSLPPGLELKRSSAEYEQLGVWCTKPVASEELFGPYEGEIIAVSEDNEVDYRYAWEIFDGNNEVVHVVNATDPKDGNWMRYVRSARCRDEQNLISCQQDGQIFYKVIKDIKPGEELLVWLNVGLKTKNRIIRQRQLKAEARAAARAKAQAEQEEEERRRKDSTESASDKSDSREQMEEEEAALAAASRKHSLSQEEDSTSEASARPEPASKRARTEGKGSRESKVVQEVCAAATQMTKGDMTLSNIKVYSCEPGQEFVFDMSRNHQGTGRTGRPCFRCQVCESAQPSMESLRKHFISSHVCYRYLSRVDQDRYQVVAEKQELKIRARQSLKGAGKPGSKVEVTSTEQCSHPGLYRCHLCYDLFDEEALLVKHLKSKDACPERRSRSQPLGCQSCTKTFSSLRLLLAHMSEHHSDEDSSFRHCDQCDETFATAGEVKRHMCSGTLRCSPCQELFRSVEDLRKHQAERHAGETAEGEGPSPAVHSTAKKRAMRMLGKKVLCLFWCAECQRGFTSSMDLDRHRASVHTPDPYSLDANILKQAKLKPTDKCDLTFFNNVSENIAINLTQYLDGGAESLANARRYISIPDYDQIEERTPPKIDWQKHNYPPYYQPYESVHPVASTQGDGQGGGKGTTTQDLLEMSSVLEGAGDMRLTRSSLSQISRQARRSLSRQKSTECSRSEEERQEGSSSQAVEESALQDGGGSSKDGMEEEAAGKVESGAGGCGSAGSDAGGSEPMDTSAAPTSEQSEQEMEVGGSVETEVSGFKVPPEKLNGIIDSQGICQEEAAENGRAALTRDADDTSAVSGTVDGVKPKGSLGSGEELDLSSTEQNGSSSELSISQSSGTRESVDLEARTEPMVVDNDDSSVFGELGEEANKENCGDKEFEVGRLDEGRLSGEGDSEAVLEESDKLAAAEADSDSSRSSPPPPVLSAISDHQQAGKGPEGSSASGDSSGSGVGADSLPPPLSPVLEARNLPDFFGKNSQDENRNDLVDPSELAAPKEEGACSGDKDGGVAPSSLCASVPAQDAGHLCSGEVGMDASTSLPSVPTAAAEVCASSSKCLNDQCEESSALCSDAEAKGSGSPSSPDRFPRALSLRRRKDGEDSEEDDAMVVDGNVVSQDGETQARALSPRSHYEKYAFGKNGPILYVCTVCKKQYYDQESCERHQLKWHPTISCSILTVEGGNGIEDLLIRRPSNVGILASSTPVPEDIHNLPSYSCTRCGMTCKSIHRLHYHIIMCDPNRPEEEKSKKKKKKKKRSAAEAELEGGSQEAKKVQGPSAPKKQKNSIGTTTMQKAQASVKRAKSRIRQKKKKFPIEEPVVDPLQTRRRRSKNYELQYNPQRHRRRREMTELLENHLCRGCETTFKSLSLLERHARKCTGKDRLQNQKPVLSSAAGDNVKAQLPCRYCSKKFSYLKTLANHYRKFCVVRKEKKKRGDLTDEDTKDEQALFAKIRQLEQTKTSEGDGKKGKGGWPKGMKRKGRRKHQLWTCIKRRTRSTEVAAPLEENVNLVWVIPEKLPNGEHTTVHLKEPQGKKSKNGSLTSNPTKSSTGKSPAKAGGSSSAAKSSSSGKSTEVKNKGKTAVESAKSEKQKKTTTPVKSKLTPEKLKTSQEKANTPADKSRATPDKSERPMVRYSLATKKSSKPSSKKEGSKDHKEGKTKGSLLKQALESKVGLVAANGHSSKNNSPGKNGTTSKNGTASKNSTASKNGTAGKSNATTKCPEKKSVPPKGSVAKSGSNGTASGVSKKASPAGKAAGSKQPPSSKTAKPAAEAVPRKLNSSLDCLQKSPKVVIDEEALSKKYKVVKPQPGKPGKVGGTAVGVRGGSEAQLQEDPAVLAARAPNLYSCLTEGKAAVDCSPSGSEASR